MCGRFALSAKTKDIEKLVPSLKISEEMKPRFNIAPTQQIAVVLNKSPQELSYVKWGLIPFWAKDKSIGTRLINARAESLNEKPAFKNSFKNKRCLIFANGFYEWKSVSGKRKAPYFIKLKTGEPFTFAGLWDSWFDTETETKITSATIITTEPNEMIAEVHNRMPVILQERERQLWLDDDINDVSFLSSILLPYPAELMEAYETSLRVNNAQFDDELCIAPISA
jgi:putative SOS response-associated peptidase YedK